MREIGIQTKLQRGMRHCLIRSALNAAFALLISGLPVFAAMARAPSIPVANISGPIPVTAQSGEPFRGRSEQPVAGPGLPLPILQPYGYIDEEYVVSGTVDGRPYSTSLLVRKPKDARKFSGLVAVETVHASGAIPFWGTGREVWMPGGHAWVLVASQRAALEMQVKKSNPERYAALQIPEAPAAAAAPGATPMSGGAQDTISQEIMTQVGALLKSNAKNGPFAGMRVRYLLMGGASQTGGTTLRYIQQSQAHARLPDGKPIYDGFFPMAAFVTGPLSGGDAAVIHAVNEGDFELFRSVIHAPGFARRGDSDASNDRYREFEVVAASHVPTRGVDDPKTLIPTLDKGVAPGEHLSQFPSAPIFKMALIDLIDWVTKGVAPPHAPPIEMLDGEIVRDEFGNAKGGVRSPYVDMPTVRYIASAPVTDGNMARRMLGLQEPIAAEELLRLYQSRSQYLERFNRAMDKMVSEHWLLAEDGAKLTAEEAKNPPL